MAPPQRRANESSSESEEDLAKFREAAITIEPQTSAHRTGENARHSRKGLETKSKSRVQLKSLRRDKNIDPEDSGFPQALSYFTPEFKNFVAKKLSDYIDGTFKVKMVKTGDSNRKASSTSDQSPLRPSSSSASSPPSWTAGNSGARGPCQGRQAEEARGEDEAQTRPRRGGEEACDDVQSPSRINLSFNNDDSGIRLFSNGPRIRLPHTYEQLGRLGCLSDEDSMVNGEERSNHREGKKKKRKIKPDLLGAIRRKKNLLEDELSLGANARHPGGDPNGQPRSHAAAAKKPKVEGRDNSSSSEDDSCIREAAVSPQWVLNQRGVFS